jgi:hypothetical protein
MKAARLNILVIDASTARGAAKHNCLSIIFATEKGIGRYDHILKNDFAK